MSKLFYYGGDGFGGLKEEGNYVIKVGSNPLDEAEVSFKSLSEAKAFYDDLDGPKAFWDRDSMELIDCWEIKR